MKTLLFATSNSHKLNEVKVIFPEIKWLSLADFPKLQDLAPEETGATFEENAQLKAKAYGQASGVATVTEDAGIEVSTLDNQPGIHSNRWAKGSDRDRCIALLKKLGNETNRSARYVSVACYYNPKTEEMKCFEGIVTGTIAPLPAGNAGFGYDPIFIPDGYTQTFAQLGESVKHTLSHRWRAFQKLKNWIHNPA